MDRDDIISDPQSDQFPAERGALKPSPSVGGNSENSPTLEQYTRDKLSLSREVHALENFFRLRGSKGRESRCHDLLVKLAEDRFALAVVGQFKRGKSSLMNALFGRELLPTGVLPLTSAVTVLRYGPREQITVTWEDSGLDITRSLAALNDYVTERGNPGNRKRVRAVYVEVPSPFLRRGLEFVDTPGIGSAIEANTATTYSYIPNCDAVVFVTGVDTPMTEAELDFLRRLRRDVSKVFCVVNKMDLLHREQRVEVIGFITGQIRNALASPGAAVFPVSSRLAIEEQKEVGGGDSKASGIEALRNVLDRFLSSERAEVLLRAVIERALKLLAAEQNDIRLAQQAASMSAEARQDRLKRIQIRFDAIRQTLTENIELLKAESRAAVIDSATTNLDERIELGVVGFAIGLLRSGESGNWASAKSLVQIVTRCVRDEAMTLLNEWLANRRPALNGKLAEIAADLRNKTVKLLCDVESDNGLGSARRYRPDELNIVSDGARAEQLRASSISWAPLPSRFFRHLPATMVQRRLKRWIRQNAASYARQLKEEAIRLLDKILTEQIGEMEKQTLRFVRAEESRLTNLIASPVEDSQISLAQQRERADQLENAIALLLKPVAGKAGSTSSKRSVRKPEIQSMPFLPEFVPSHVTPEILAQNLRAGGCPICRQLVRVLFDSVTNWQHLMAADDAAQRRYAEERGFCPLHTWQLASISSPRGMSAGYPRLTERLRIDLRELGDGEATAPKLKAIGVHARSCRVCGMLASVQTACVEALKDLLETDMGRKNYSSAQGVCLRHLPPLMAVVADTAMRHFLIDEAAAHLEILGEDMQSYALKQEATRRELINSNERSALQMALEKVVGLKSLCFPWEWDEVW